MICKKLLRRSFEIGQQSNLFQSLGRQILRLVDDHDDAATLGMRGQQTSIQRVDHLLDAVAVLSLDRHPSSSQMVSRNSTGVTRGFRITATSA